jgi:hypothetical protein
MPTGSNQRLNSSSSNFYSSKDRLQWQSLTSSKQQCLRTRLQVGNATVVHLDVA